MRSSSDEHHSKGDSLPPSKLQEKRISSLLNLQTAMTRGARSLPPLSQETHPDGDDDDDGQDPAKNVKHQASAKTSNYERQQRYRDKQRQYVIRLESTVKRLRIDVDQLLIVRHRAQETQREARSGVCASLISTATMTAFVTTMCECMQSFESGAREQQAKFLESSMREDVQYGDLVGRQIVLDQWTQFAPSFDGIPPLSSITHSRWTSRSKVQRSGTRVQFFFFA